MILELFGLSGSGKSTLARGLDTAGEATRIRITSTPELLWRSMYYIAQNPVTSMHQLRYLFLYSGSLALFYTKFMNLFLHHAAKRQKAETTKGTVVIDQGHLQNLLSLFESPQPPHVFTDYLRYVPLPDQVWILEVGESERARRLEVRGHEGRKGESGDKRIARERVIAVNFNTIVLILKSLPLLKVRVIPPEQNIAMLTV